MLVWTHYTTTNTVLSSIYNRLYLLKMVPRKRFELSRLTALAPKANVSAFHHPGINWCQRRELNPHGFTRQILSLLCLPFHHSDKMVRAKGFEPSRFYPTAFEAAVSAIPPRSLAYWCARGESNPYGITTATSKQRVCHSATHAHMECSAGVEPALNRLEDDCPFHWVTSTLNLVCLAGIEPTL